MKTNGIGNAYNITKTAGTNIVGGPYTGGNYWAKPDGTGFSQKAVDRDGDGISDSAYTRISGSRYSDFLPLVIYKPPEPIIPVANFWGSPRSGEAPLNVTFTDISTGTPTSWNWSFGDGTYSTDENPVHAYSTAGTYSVTLTDSNAAGNDSMTKNNYIIALQKPVADFWGSPRSGEAPLNVTFTDISTGTPTSWKWSFGDGTYSTDENPVHAYSTAGTYSVTLTDSNAAGNDSMTKNNYIIALQKPVADFWGSPRSGEAPLNVTFTDISTGTPTSWNWSFGDGTYSTDENPVHAYSTAGTYSVTLTDSNAAGSDSMTKNNYIIALQKPVADFWGSPRSGEAPLNVTFTDISTGTPTSWNWSFGDGTYSTDENPVHAYSTAGTYSVTLTDSNAAGNDSMTKNNYIIALQKPVADFWGSPRSGEAPLNVTFTDISTGTPTSWNWSFGDKSTSTAKNPVHKYTQTGIYTVTLTSSNAAGSNSITKSSYVTVLIPPIASFTATPTTGKAPITVTFTDRSTNNPTSWNWSFGDKSTSTAKNPVHKYTQAGKYTVILTVKNAAGSNSITKSSYVTVLIPPVASFTATPTTGKAPLTVTFTDKSTNNPTAWSWSFGDKSTSTTKNPVHKYTQTGKYTVTLTSSNTAGSNSITKSGFITVK